MDGETTDNLVVTDLQFIEPPSCANCIYLQRIKRTLGQYKCKLIGGYEGSYDGTEQKICSQWTPYNLYDGYNGIFNITKKK